MGKITMKVNTYCRDLGWLFEDFKADYDAHPACYATDAPDPDADAWICIRTSDMDSSGCDPARTAIQIHDNFDRTGDIDRVNECGGIILTHLYQIGMLEACGVDWTGKSVMMRPIGAKESFFSVDRASRDRFTVGWVGRMHRQKGEGVCAEVLARVREWADVMLVGAQFENIQQPEDRVYLKGEHPHRLWPELYAQMDCLLITSPVEAGPIPLFEALAVGVPVVGTACGWVPQMVRMGRNGFAIDPCAPDLAKTLSRFIQQISENRERWLERAPAIRATAQGWTHEGWIDDTVLLASRLGRVHGS